MLSNLRATALYPLPLGLPALATLLGACALVVDVEDCRSDAVCGQGRVCVDGTCLTVAPSPSEVGAGGALPTDEDAGRPGLAAPPLPEGCDESLLVGGALLHSRLLGAASSVASVVQTLEVDAPADLPVAYDGTAVVDLTFEAFIRVGDRGDYTFEGTAATAIQQTVALDGRPVARGGAVRDGDAALGAGASPAHLVPRIGRRRRRDRSSLRRPRGAGPARARAAGDPDAAPVRRRSVAVRDCGG